MRVLRSNKDSVMAMLEAFVHDPLINWRLLNTPETVAPDANTIVHPDHSDLPNDMQLLSEGPCLIVAQESQHGRAKSCIASYRKKDAAASFGISIHRVCRLICALI